MRRLRRVPNGPRPAKPPFGLSLRVEDKRRSREDRTPSGGAWAFAPGDAIYIGRSERRVQQDAAADGTADDSVSEATVLRYDPDTAFAVRLGAVEVFEPRRKSIRSLPFCAVQVVPTGLRCETGGFAGDACPATNLLAAAADYVI